MALFFRQPCWLRKKCQIILLKLIAKEEEGERKNKDITIQDLRKNKKVSKKAHKALGSLGLLESDQSSNDSSTDSSDQSELQDLFCSNISQKSELIQQHGDWVSDCYKEYLTYDFEQKLSVSKRMCSFIVNN